MEAILSRLAAVPGVIGASGASALPFDGATMTSTIELPGDSALGSSAPKREANRRSVLPNTFAILGIPLLAGRAFTATDRAGAPLVIIVSEALARREWPTESALGKQVKLGRWWTVVGIVGDTKFNSLTDHVEPTMYMSYAQEDADVEFAVKTKGDPVRLARAIRAAIADVSPLSEVTSIERMDDMVRASMSEERFRTTLIDVFGAMAIILTAIGLYGLTSRMVARRTRESGIRIALGATPASVRRLILRRTMSIVAVGALLGIGLAVPVTRALASYLFGIRPADPATYLVTTMFLAVVALIASALPARRIGRLSPTTVLRAE